MALSEQEQRLLDEMERHLYQNDADVVSTAGSSSGGVTTRSVVLAILSIAVGLGVVLGGLALHVPIVGVLGFLVMLAGVLFAFRRRPANAAERSDDPSPSGPKPEGKSKSSFMDNLEQRWDRRNGSDG